MVVIVSIIYGISRLILITTFLHLDIKLLSNIVLFYFIICSYISLGIILNIGRTESHGVSVKCDAVDIQPKIA